MKLTRTRAALLAPILLTSACNFQRIAANQTAEIAEAGSAGVNGFWDYEIFGAAVPNALVQGEALLRVSPDNEKILISQARSYVAYTYGWVQSEWELADERGEFARADQIERRVFELYKRASQLALKVVHKHDDDHQLTAKLKSGKVDVVKDYLRKTFTKQDDVAGLYWAGLAWGSMIANSGGDMNQLADAPIARSLLERSVELDPTYADAGGLAVLGTVEASFPELFGGDLNKAKAYYDRALEICKRRNHLILLSYAKVYAVAKQDRELFVSLLNEILTAPDQGDDVRMNNKVARKRAEHYLARLDDWFPPARAETTSGDERKKAE